MAGNASPNRRLKTRHERSEGEVTALLVSGGMQILKFEHGFILTEIRQFEDEKVLHVYWLGGVRFAEWAAEAVAALRELGARHGCAAIEAHCRPGLARMLKAHAFKTQKITIRAAI